MKQNGDFIGGVKKKILALAGAEGRHKNMFSAIISTTATQLVRIKEDEAKENEQKTPRRSPVWLPSSVPYLGIISGFLNGHYLGGRVQCYSNVCWVMRAAPAPPLTVANSLEATCELSRYYYHRYRAD